MRRVKQLHTDQLLLPVEGLEHMENGRKVKVLHHVKANEVKMVTRVTKLIYMMSKKYYVCIGHITHLKISHDSSISSILMHNNTSNMGRLPDRQGGTTPTALLVLCQLPCGDEVIGNPVPLLHQRP
mmetsp:Transcript_16789/g.35146  ORF Transcript_16789/g.35146 Transcript_16789/m.35146 type:complete len:126 (+) Transcript_16789:1085-1462(+)